MYPVKGLGDKAFELMGKRETGRMQAVGLRKQGGNPIDRKDTAIEEAKQRCQ
jgi:hypothetical protein